MTDLEQLLAIEEIRTAKARYFRGVDTADGELVRSILSADCVLDYLGCCTDPATGRDFFPAMNVVVRGAASWSSKGLRALGVVSVHQGHDCDVAFTSAASAEVVWSMTDRLFMPPGGPFACITGYGHYHETYGVENGRWKIRTLRISRLRVEAR